MEVGLEITSGGKTLLWRSIDRHAFSVGSNPDCDLCVPGPEVPPIQMVLRITDERLSVENSSQEPFNVAGETVPPQASFVLANGDAFEIGDLLTTVRFVESTHPEGSSGRTRTLSSMAPGAQAALILRLPQVFPEESWSIDSSGITLGSDEGNSIVLQDPYVSGFHAQFSLQDGRCFVRDLGSRNGIFIGEQMVRDAEVHAGTVLRIGQTDAMIGTVNQAPEVRPSTNFVARSESMSNVGRMLERYAATDASVLIIGETGTGKEVAANRLRALSKRSDKPFRALNCGAFSGNLIQSELFGHEKGAFTGADSRRQGAFESTDGGSLFLDELGELPIDLQPPLLRVVESGELFRVGGDKSIRVDVRLIAATNRNLETDVKAGRFRRDLLHRLNILTLELPPLRDRKEDIAPLAAHFLAQFTPTGARLHLADSAHKKLLTHTWSGNVRELRNVLQRAVLMRENDTIEAKDLVFQSSSVETRSEVAGAVTGLTLQEIEKRAIMSALVQAEGNKTTAAEALGIARSTVHRKMQQHHITDDMVMAALEGI